MFQLLLRLILFIVLAENARNRKKNYGLQALEGKYGPCYRIELGGFKLCLTSSSLKQLIARI